MNRIFKAIAGVLLLASTVATAAESGSASASTESLYVSTTGEVILTFLSQSAYYSSDLFYASQNSVAPTNFVLNNQTAVAGTTYSLGTFQAGSIINFKLFVNNTGDNFFNGLASLNSDQVVHSAYLAQGGSTVVGFEDFVFGGDQDFNDLIFSVSNTRIGMMSPAPEPEMAGMLLAGLALLGFAKRRKNK